MAFDIHAPVLDAHGDIDDAAAETQEKELLVRFAASAEAAPFLERGDAVGFASKMLFFARFYQDVTVTTMSAGDLAAVLLDDFPGEMLCQPEDAPEIMAQVRAFWSYVKREFGLPNADACLAVLDEGMALALAHELRNPDKFRGSKAFLWDGLEAGFDVTTDAGLAAWTRAYDESLPDLEPWPAQPRVPVRTERNKRKARRRAQRASRRKNR
jgi:hypothetical protein